MYSHYSYPWQTTFNWSDRDVRLSFIFLVTFGATICVWHTCATQEHLLHNKQEEYHRVWCERKIKRRGSQQMSNNCRCSPFLLWHISMKKAQESGMVQCDPCWDCLVYSSLATLHCIRNSPTTPVSVARDNRLVVDGDDIHTHNPSTIV
jgi:hypothetical protein